MNGPARDNGYLGGIVGAQAFMKGKGMRRASLIGQSLGGWVAGWMAHSCPELVEKLVLVNTNGFRPIPPEIVRKIREGSMAAVENLSRESMIARLRPLVLDPKMISD